MACHDANACTIDYCDAGSCVHKPLNCDDGSACTTDSCEPADLGCVHASVGCEDADACTLDECAADAGCTHDVLSCDDGNPCTVDGCSSLTGCSHADDCDDQDACTEDACTEDGTCANAPKACDDGNPCTTDECKKGQCKAKPVDCGDGDACTIDKCDPTTGNCVYVPETCSYYDLCQEWTCDPKTWCQPLGPKPPCDDGAPCTVDSCSPAIGCTATPIKCNDDEQCTEDACVGGQCVYKPIAGPCVDSDPCTVDDTCQQGTCVGVPGTPDVGCTECSVVWERTYDEPLVPGGNNGELTAVALLPSGEALFATAGSWFDGGVLVRLDQDGNPTWTKDFSTEGQAVNWQDMVANAGDGVALVADVSSGIDDTGAWIAGIAADGKTTWLHTYDSGTSWKSGWRLQRIVKTADGGLAAGGLAEAKHALLARLTSAGDVLWSNAYPGPGDGYVSAITQLMGGGFALGGMSWTLKVLHHDAYIVATSAEGEFLWESVYPFGVQTDVKALAPHADGGLVAVGSHGDTTDVSNPLGGVLVFHADSNGDLVWSTVIPGFPESLVVSAALVTLSESKYLIGAHAPSPLSTANRLLARVDADGTVVWSHVYPSTASGRIVSMARSTDGSVLLGGLAEWSYYWVSRLKCQ